RKNCGRDICRGRLRCHYLMRRLIPNTTHNHNCCYEENDENEHKALSIHYANSNKPPRSLAPGGISAGLSIPSACLRLGPEVRPSPRSITCGEGTSKHAIGIAVRTEGFCTFIFLFVDAQSIL